MFGKRKLIKELTVLVASLQEELSNREEELERLNAAEKEKTETINKLKSELEEANAIISELRKKPCKSRKKKTSKNSGEKEAE